MSFIGSFMGGMAARAAVPVVAAAGFGAYQGGAFETLPISLPGTGPSHYDMSARIVGIERVCRLTFRKDGQLNRTSPMDCRQAVQALTQPVFRNYQLQSTLEIDYRYYAPDGEQTLLDSVSLPDAGNVPYRVNDVIQIRVNAKNPRDTKVI